MDPENITNYQISNNKKNIYTNDYEGNAINLTNNSNISNNQYFVDSSKSILKIKDNFGQNEAVSIILKDGEEISQKELDEFKNNMTKEINILKGTASKTKLTLDGIQNVNVYKSYTDSKGSIQHKLVYNSQSTFDEFKENLKTRLSSYSIKH